MDDSQLKPPDLALLAGFSEKKECADPFGSEEWDECERISFRSGGRCGYLNGPPICIAVHHRQFPKLPNSSSSYQAATSRDF